MIEYTQEQLNEVASKNIRSVAPFSEILMGWTVRLRDDGVLVLAITYDVWDQEKNFYAEKEKEVLL